MGTNYYRVPSPKEMEIKRRKLIEKVAKMEISPCAIERGFSKEYGTDKLGFHSFDSYTPWDEFSEDTCVHLGKRSGGWQFAWNHNDWKYYRNKLELFEFIREGRVVDEYGTEIAPEDFLEMAINWCPDGFTNEKYMKEELIAKGKKPLYPEHYVDIIVDGLRFMNTVEFS